MGLFGFLRDNGKGGNKSSRSTQSFDNKESIIYSCDDDDDEEEDDDEALSVYDAADIWLSHGKDEDYTFGYTEEELERALR